MKYHLHLFLGLLLGSSSVFAQSGQRPQARSCGAGCSVVTVSVKNDRACNGDHDLSYTVRNNTGEALDIATFVQKRSGGWKSLGLATNVGPGDERDDIWGCDLSGYYILYYRSAGSNDHIPWESELNR